MFRKFLHSFRYAANGIRSAIHSEQNMRVHMVVGAYVYFFSLFYNFSKIEYCVLTILIFGVMALELMNSSIERSVDKPTPGKFYIVGAVKDMAAGAVLVFSIGAAICGFILFWDIPTIKHVLFVFSHNLVALAMLIISMICSLFFIFRKGDL